MLELFGKVFGMFLFTRRRAVPRMLKSPSFPTKLNMFFSSFDHQDTVPVTVSFPVTDSLLPRPFTVEEAEVRNLFRKQNIRKATGPDGVSTATLKHCSRQLSSFCFYFQQVFMTVYGASFFQIFYYCSCLQEIEDEKTQLIIL